MNTEFKKIRVSLVEDCLLTRISIKHFLSLQDDIEIVKDYDSADDFLLSLEKTRPDVILMDLDLKGMNGIQATQYIKQNFPDVKVVVLTIHTTKDFFAASMFSGANAFVVKTTDMDNLVRIIKTVYFGAYWIDPKLVNMYKQSFPKPDSFDLYNLYNKKSSFDLTAREMEVLRLVVQGKTNTEIAEEMIVSTNTAKAHVGKILNKMKVSDRVQAAVMAVKSNMI